VNSFDPSGIDNPANVFRRIGGINSEAKDFINESIESQHNDCIKVLVLMQIALT